MTISSIPMSGRANAPRAPHCLPPQLRRRSAFLKASQPVLTRTINGIEDVMDLHCGLKTLSVIGPTLSRNHGASRSRSASQRPRQLGFRRPSARYDRQVRIDAHLGIINAILISLAWAGRRPISARTECGERNSISGAINGNSERRSKSVRSPHDSQHHADRKSVV